MSLFFFWSKRAQIVCSHGVLLTGSDNKGQLLLVVGMSANVSKLVVLLAGYMFGRFCEIKNAPVTHNVVFNFVLFLESRTSQGPIRFSCLLLRVSSTILPIFFSDFVKSEFQNYLVVANTCSMVSIADHL